MHAKCKCPQTRRSGNSVIPMHSDRTIRPPDPNPEPTDSDLYSLPGDADSTNAPNLGSDPSSILVGRERELDVLRRSKERAEGGWAQVVVIEGEPGMGKTALLNNFIDRYELRSRTMWVRGDEFESDMPLGAVADLLRSSDVTAGSDIEAGKRVLSHLNESQQGSGIVVLVIDDAHWVDSPSARSIRFAIRRLSADRVLAIVARRPGHPDDFGEDPATSVFLRLQPLDDHAVRELAVRSRSWRLSPTTAQQLVRRTGGLPLLLLALLRGAADESQLVSNGYVPESAASAVGRMLRSIGGPARNLIEASAVMRDATDLIALGQIGEVDDPSSALTAALSTGLLTIRSTGYVGCTHSLLRDALYAVIPYARRRELHSRAALWTTGDRQLAHRTAAADQPDLALVEELIVAADVARAADNHSLSAAHRLRAREVSADAQERQRFLLDAMLDRLEAEDLDKANQLAPAVQMLGASARRSLVLGLLARDAGQVSDAKVYLREAREYAADSNDIEILERAALAEAVLQVRLGEGIEALRSLDRVKNLSDPAIAADVTLNRAFALYHSDRLSEAVEAIGTDGAKVSVARHADLFAARGMMLMYTGRLVEAASDLDTAIGMVHRRRESTNHSRTYSLRSVARFHLGDWDGAVADAAAARALAYGYSQPWSAAPAHAVSVDVPAHRGQWAIAIDHMARAKAAAEAVRSPQINDLVLQHEVALASLRGEHQLVLRLMEPMMAAEHLNRLVAVRYYRRTLSARVIALIGMRRLDDAASALDDYAAIVRDISPEGLEPARLGWLRGQLAMATNRPTAALGHYLDDLNDPATQASPYARADVLVSVGSLNRMLGEHETGVLQLREARTILTRLRATPLLQRCAAALADANSQPIPITPLPLTEREEAIAALAAHGHTNKEIAGEVFLTEKTVEYHLRKVYTKLGIINRRELRRFWPNQTHIA